MIRVKKRPSWISFACSPRAKRRRISSPSKSQSQLGKENKPSAWDVSGTQSHVLAKSHPSPDFQQLQQAWNRLYQKEKAASKKPSTKTCPFGFTSKGDKAHAVPSADTAAAPELPAGSPNQLSRSQGRGPLEEIQLGATAQNTTPGSSVAPGKEVNTVEFVADPVALTSTLSNVGLASSTLGVTRKPRLARRAPLRGSRGNSVQSNRSTRTLHGSRYMALCPDSACSSSFSRPAAKDGDQLATQHRDLPLSLQQTQEPSAVQKDLGVRTQAQSAGHPALQSQGTGVNQAHQGHPPPIATATQHEAARSEDAGGTRDQSTDSRPTSPSDGRATGSGAGAGGQSATNSDPAMRKDPVGASQTEELVTNPDALASVLSNVGLSHASLGPTGKISLAQRVPVKGLQRVLPPTAGGTMGSRTSQLRHQGSRLPKGSFGRTSCRSVLGLKGLEAPDVLQTAQQLGALRTQKIKRYSPYGLARRVPVTQPQALRGTFSSRQRNAAFPRTPCSGEPLDKGPAWGALPGSGEQSWGVGTGADQLFLVEAKGAPIPGLGSWKLLLGPQVRGPQKGNLDHKSSHSVLGLKGLEAPGVLQAAQQLGALRTQKIKHYSPYGLARRVPVTQPQALLGTFSSRQRNTAFPRTPCSGEPLDKGPARGALPGSWKSLLGPQVRGPQKGNLDHKSSHSVLGLKGLEAPGVLQAAQQLGALRTQKIKHYSPYGLARRVPVTQPQALRGSCPPSHCKAIFPHVSRREEPLDKGPARGALPTPARWAATLSPEPGTSDPDELALPCDKIAVSLFGDVENQGMAEVTVRNSQTQPAVPQWSSKAQCIEILARLLQQEMKEMGSFLSLEELNRFLVAYAPASCLLPPPPQLAASSGLQHLPSSSSCCDRGLDPVPLASRARFPAADTTLTFSSQQPICATPPTGRDAAGAEAAPTAPPSCEAVVKQQLKDQSGARLKETLSCLDDEVAFYMSRVPSTQPCAPRCPDPVARLLEAQETRCFIPIGEPVPSNSPVEAGSSAQQAQ